MDLIVKIGARSLMAWKKLTTENLTLWNEPIQIKKPGFAFRVTGDSRSPIKVFDGIEGWTPISIADDWPKWRSWKDCGYAMLKEETISGYVFVYLKATSEPVCLKRAERDR